MGRYLVMEAYLCSILYQYEEEIRSADITKKVDVINNPHDLMLRNYSIHMEKFCEYTSVRNNRLYFCEIGISGERVQEPVSLTEMLDSIVGLPYIYMSSVLNNCRDICICLYKIAGAMTGYVIFYDDAGKYASDDEIMCTVIQAASEGCCFGEVINGKFYACKWNAHDQPTNMSQAICFY